jgi:hypothetical protein
MNETNDNDAELEQFSAVLAEALPRMNVESLARVKEQMTAELDRQKRGQTRRRAFAGAAVAAAILLAIFGYAVSRHPDGASPEPPAQAVRDRVQVIHGDTMLAADVGKPVIALDDFRSLYLD